MEPTARTPMGTLSAMHHEFRMPDIGEGLTEAEIVVWLVSEGETVASGQPVVEVETAKTTVEIPAPYAGAVLRLVGDPGDTVNVGDVLFVVDDLTGGDTAADTAGSGHAPPTVVAASRADETPIGGSPEAVKAMPAVRRLARELGVDLTGVDGSGPGGRITAEDVERAAAPRDESLEPLSPTRRAIAAHMTESWTTIPHVTVQAEIRAEALLEGRDTAGRDRPLAVEALVAAAVMPLLRRYREFNAAYRDGAVAYAHPIHMGFAVDTDAGLMVVVVRDADHLGVGALSDEFERLAKAAIDRTIGPDALTGQTFTISNIGALGGGHGTPIIPMGTSAILSIGRATARPVIEHGELAIGTVAPIDLSYDHRLIDGGLGQRFLGDLVQALEAPTSDRA
jgi:pyruvate dehydrogenase E2 component (dihydrolipoamide acetyltransferase)